ncbi:MAG: rod shape-determining protein RodA [Pseudomonadota bacterium]
MDYPLLYSLLTLGLLGFVVLYSASGENIDVIYRQAIRFAIGFFVMFLMAQITPDTFRHWSPWCYVAGMLLLIAVLFFGETGKGAQRWLDIGFVRFQPSELMKLAVPMMIAWFVSERPLPPRFTWLLGAVGLILLPALLIAQQPDLGTALLISAAGFFVLFLAGMRWRLLLGIGGLGLASLPVLWHFMRDYQRTRVITVLNPESDPLGAGYHIIQSKIAVGSGGTFGKGWLNGTQSHLDFLPERSTDFIFAVFGEEFGFVGAIAMIALYLFIVARGLYIAATAQGSYSRLLAGSLSLTFFIYLVVNLGMVIGLLPVVGVPLPLVSYGGTSIVTLLAGFGILMSAQAHKRLLSG